METGGAQTKVHHLNISAIFKFPTLVNGKYFNFDKISMLCNNMYEKERSNLTLMLLTSVVLKINLPDN